MKKAASIILMLTLVVLVSSMAVWFVESKTTPVRDKLAQDKIEAALKEVYPEIEGSGYDVNDEPDLDFGNSGINSALVITDGDIHKAVVYTVGFNGYNPGITYIISINNAGEITGYQTLSQNDTAGFGGQIADPINWIQFTGMLIETAGEGNFDGLSGASITTGAWKASFAKLYEFHAANFPVQPLTDEQKAMVAIKAIVPEGTTLSPYEFNDYDFADYDILGAYVANDGSSDVVVGYHVQFVGYNTNDFNEYIISIDLTSNEVLGYVTLYSGDTTEFGGKMIEEERFAQFTGKSLDDLNTSNFDGVSGASITTGAWEKSLQSVSIYHNAEFLGNVVLTPEQQFEVYKEELFPTATRFENVTAEKKYNFNVTQIFDAYDDGDTYLGVVYYVTTLGASYSEPTYIQFLVGIDASNEFTGFKMFKTTDTADRVAPFFEDDFADELIGDLITGEYGIDAVSEATNTSNVINAVLEDIVEYHENDYYSRPDSIVVDNADLLLAYPTAASFESIYENYEFNSTIGNLYAAKDGSDAVIGYVYYGTTKGFGNSTIEFTWGVDVSGLTQQIHIISGSQSWGDAAEYSDYNGSYGEDFATSTWLNLFEGVTLTSVVDSPIDGVSGVSTTTGGFSNPDGGMKSALETIAQYHSDNSVGGGS